MSKGATRSDASELRNFLVPSLPQELHPSIKPFELRGLRNYSTKIPVAPKVIREIKGIWSDNLKVKRVTGPGGCELYVTLQKSPEQRARCGTMGKLLEFIQETKPEGKFKAFWVSDFCIYLDPPEGQPGQATLVASLDSGNNAKWEPPSQEVLGMDPSQASELFVAHCRK